MTTKKDALLLAIDQGTTSSRVIIFNAQGEAEAQHQIDLPQSYPQPGWVEQNPLHMWEHTLTCAREALKKLAVLAQDITAIGITNQRETTIVWNKKTGVPIYPAIVWQDRRTSPQCDEYIQAGKSDLVSSKTGLIIDSYFSATKIAWILDHVPDARSQASRGELAFGTVDTYLLWKLTKGKVHATDATNASRTLLFNIHTQAWDAELLALFDIPETLLPTVLNSADDFGQMDAEWLGAEIPIAAMIGDQQAAAFGQACFKPGMGKATFGTGCFVLLNTGDDCVQSTHRLLSTVAYRLKDKVTYCLEGSIFSAGTIINWLRDNLKILSNAAESEKMAMQVDSTEGVYFIPAFTGLGAPYWNADARAALIGMHYDTRAEHIVRAGLEAVCYQTRDLLECARLDGLTECKTLRVNGGMAMNNWLLQFLANVLNVPVESSAIAESTALGAAFLAGLHKNVYASLDEIASFRQESLVFEPKESLVKMDNLYNGWKKAVETIMMHA